MSSEFVARKGLIIKSAPASAWEDDVLVRDPSSDLVSVMPFTGFVTNVTDTFTSVPSATKIITLTAAEYAGIGAKDPNTLYILVG